MVLMENGQVKERYLDMQVPCPECGVDHLHVDLSVVKNGHFVTVGQDSDVLLIHEDQAKPLTFEATVSCCACDFCEDRPIRMV